MSQTVLKKAACICNINQMQFGLARYLRDLKYDVTLFLIDEYDHFAPENDATEPIKDITIVKLPWRKSNFASYSSSEIRKELDGFDVYCGSEIAPAFLAKAGLTMDIFIPIGTDLTHYPFFKSNIFRLWDWQYSDYEFSVFQKMAIRNAKNTFVNFGGDAHLERAIQKIKLKGIRHKNSLPYMYFPDFDKVYETSKIPELIAEHKLQGKFLMISTCRCEFVDPNSIHYKGTDILIRSLKQYVENGNKDCILFLFDYGNDKLSTRALIDTLGMAEFVVWLPLSGRLKIIEYVKSCDVSIGILGQSYWSYGSAMESLFCRVPFVHRGFEVSKWQEMQLYPCWFAHNEFTFGAAIDSIRNEKEESITKVQQAFHWYKNRIIDQPIILLQEVLLKLEEVKNIKAISLLILRIKLRCIHGLSILISKFCYQMHSAVK